MSSPRYIRRANTDDEYTPKKLSSVDGLRNETEEESLHVAGLREKRLITLIVWLVVLGILAIIVLICNIMLITVLQMTHQGMRSVRIQSYEDPKTRKQESVVYMTGENVDLGHVIANSGHVIGPKAQTMNIDGTRVVINGGENKTQLVMQDGICRFDSHNNFKIISSQNGKTMFSAQHPLITIDQRIKKISTNRIVTNKIRSPVNQNLNISGEDVNLRGNEGIRIQTRKFFATASTVLRLKTSADGALRMSARKIRFSGNSSSLPLSSSPALKASVDGFRLCVCSTKRPKLFLVGANKPCKASSAICK